MPTGDLHTTARSRPIIPVVKTRPESKYSPDANASLLRQVERKRRMFARRGRALRFSRQQCLDLTLASFQLEQLKVTPQEAEAATARGFDRRLLRSPQSLRLRNHLAIIQSIQRLGNNSAQLQPAAVMRWYTSLSCGLSIAVADEPQHQRLTELLQEMHWPIRRLWPAISQIASLHLCLLSDPLFPGFNGIMARLLLQYHLTRCQLPLVILSAPHHGALAKKPMLFTRRLLEWVGRSYDLLLQSENDSA